MATKIKLPKKGGVKRAMKALKRDPHKPTKALKALMKKYPAPSKMERLEKFLKENNIEYKITSYNGITPTILMGEFDDDGN